PLASTWAVASCCTETLWFPAMAPEPGLAVAVNVSPVADVTTALNVSLLPNVAAAFDRPSSDDFKVLYADRRWFSLLMRVCNAASGAFSAVRSCCSKSFSGSPEPTPMEEMDVAMVECSVFAYYGRRLFIHCQRKACDATVLCAFASIRTYRIRPSRSADSLGTA